MEVPHNIFFSPGVSAKIKSKHSVTEDEVRQCFANVEGGFLLDDREEHRTDPPTHWFMAETDQGRKLKVCFIFVKTGPKTGEIHIKTAYTANQEVQNLYRKMTSGK
ncbi:MAG: hypothetical protein KAG82_04040 [Alcanivoracaceae bacterium]|nr:hypothetical protein [Alcanivoracaceae bacterium]